jgi:cytochrome c-550 PedF
MLCAAKLPKNKRNMIMSSFSFLKIALCASALAWAPLAVSDGNVTPQPVDADELPDLRRDALTENPFRKGNDFGKFNEDAIKFGTGAFASNCAQCHGIEAKSGGLVPDLRELTEWDDEYFIGRVMNGTARGMPSFKTSLDQTTIWSIRTYLESIAIK